VNVLEVDDIHLAVEAVTTRETFPATHYWDSGVSWMDLGVEDNVNWLIDVSKELIPVLTALANRHMEDRLPIIIEGEIHFCDRSRSAAIGTELSLKRRWSVAI
jgi:hypothetical protein